MADTRRDGAPTHGNGIDDAQNTGTGLQRPELQRPGLQRPELRRPGLRPPGLLLILLAYAGFVSLGLPDAVAGVAWPSLRSEFSLSQDRFGLIFVALACGYVTSGFFAGRLLGILDVGPLLTASTAAVALAALGYAASFQWAAFLAVAVLHGLGSGAVDAALNTFAAHRLSARHMNWLHACYCLGAMLGPLVMTAVFAAGQPWRAGYVVIGGAMLVMTVLFALTRRRWGGNTDQDSAVPSAGILETLRNPTVELQMAVFFLYTGLEAATGQWAFTVLTESRGLSAESAGIWTGAYWGCIGAGRFLVGFFVDAIGIDRLLRGSLLLAVAGAALFAGSWQAGGLIGLAAIGFAFAPVFPCLMTRTPQRLGSALAAHAIGFQVSAALAGVAVFPGIIGLAVSRYGLETAPKLIALLALGLCLLHEVLLRWGQTSTAAVES